MLENRNPEMEDLKASSYFDWESPEILNLARTLAEDRSEEEFAQAVYLHVRDEIRYDPYDIRLDPERLRSSGVLKKGTGHCIDKAGLMISLLRAGGVPARLGLARVRNHLGTARLEELLGTDVLVPHGYVHVFLNGRWTKATPAFNRQLCEKLNVEVLEWDGQNDSLFQESDHGGGRFMEYLEDYGSFSDVPISLIKELMQKEYPACFDQEGNWVLTNRA